MGFLDGLKKNLGFDKAEPKPDERASEAPQGVHEPSAGESVQSGGPDASADEGAVAGSGAAVGPAEAEAAALAAVAAQQATTEQATAEQALADQAAPDQATTSAAAASAGRVTEVVVEKDDTLSGIAVQFGVDLDALIAVNAGTVPNPDHVYAGQVLRLP